ncbi:MAG: hypothetical protein ABL914_10405 [Novosphingobium sp.]
MIKPKAGASNSNYLLENDSLTALATWPNTVGTLAIKLEIQGSPVSCG